MSFFYTQCIVPTIYNILSLLLYPLVGVIRFVTNSKYAFVCIYKVRLSPDNKNLIHWTKFDHVMLLKIVINSCGTVHSKTFQNIRLFT